jgi:hypothetical protein
MSDERDDRLIDLLVKEATEALDESEARELRALLARSPDERDGFARAAAFAQLAATDESVPLPAAVAARAVAIGEAYVGGSTGVVTDAAERFSARAATSAPPAAARSAGSSAPWWAVAASLLLAVLGWYPRLLPPAPAPTPVARAETEAERLSRERDALLGRPGLVRSSFAGTADPHSGAVAGDAVWDPATQRGYLRLHGLPANDARSAQYQLWVFDAERDQKYPVDGGVFDVPDGERDVVVPIRVPLRVGQVVLFAVTVERPGGVVVSGREHIVATAKPAST